MINSPIGLEEVIGLAELTEGLLCGILPAAEDSPADVRGGRRSSMGHRHGCGGSGLRQREGEGEGGVEKAEDWPPRRHASLQGIPPILPEVSSIRRCKHSLGSRQSPVIAS